MGCQENRPEFSVDDGEKEKSLVEILLRKYGFGRWTLPSDGVTTVSRVRPDSILQILFSGSLRLLKNGFKESTHASLKRLSLEKKFLR